MDFPSYPWVYYWHYGLVKFSKNYWSTQLWKIFSFCPIWCSILLIFKCFRFFSCFFLVLVVFLLLLNSIIFVIFNPHQRRLTTSPTKCNGQTKTSHDQNFYSQSFKFWILWSSLSIFRCSTKIYILKSNFTLSAYV